MNNKETTREVIKKCQVRMSTYTPEQRQELDDRVNDFMKNADEIRPAVFDPRYYPEDKEESEGTKIAAKIRAEYQKPVDVTVRLRQGDIDLLKNMVFQPPTTAAERKYLLDLQKLSEKELAAHLVKIAVAKVVGDYARSQISPSV